MCDSLWKPPGRSRGGLIYLCNPNNPTSAITSRKDLAWLVANLPADTALVVDEAYIQFGQTAELESALPYIGRGKDVIVTRTFSKIYGMAGLRAGFAAATPEIIRRLAPLRMGVISIVSARGVVAALNAKETIVAERRAALAAHAQRAVRVAGGAQAQIHPAQRQLRDDRRGPQRPRFHRSDDAHGGGAGAALPSAGQHAAGDDWNRRRNGAIPRSVLENIFKLTPD